MTKSLQHSTVLRRQNAAHFEQEALHFNGAQALKRRHVCITFNGMLLGALTRPSIEDR